MKLKKSFCLLLFLISLLTMTSCHKKTDITKYQYDESKIKLMSFNIKTAVTSPDDEKNEDWNSRKDLVRFQIEEIIPDILCLQEVTNTQYKFLKACFKGYDMIYYHREISNNDKEGLLILFRNDRFTKINCERLWLSDTPLVPSIGWDSFYERFFIKLELEEKQSKKHYMICNVHYDYKSNQVQKYSTDVIRNNINSNIPTFIIGDFNMKKDSEAYRYLTKYFVDCQTLAPYKEDLPTYNAFGNSSIAFHADYFFTNKLDTSVDEYLVKAQIFDGIYASDHFPIVITINI